ncbi:MAG: M20/M25/M40 family metallo-hydrolase, partial [Planctomycetes bacterium]|nr:M20/M25/M40 family metallo-hydrolase [Planctomycetota bacterium]
VTAKLLEEGRQRSQVMDHLDHLVNEIGPRLTGSKRLTQAQEWAAARFRAFGLKNVRLEPWGTLEVGFDRGTHRAVMHALGLQKGAEYPLTIQTHAWTPGTNGPKRGPALLLPADQAEWQALEAKAKGAWLVLRGGTSKAVEEFAQKAGAHGVVLKGGDLLLTGGNHRTKWEQWPKVVIVRLLKKDYDDLRGRLDIGGTLDLEIDVQNHFVKGPIELCNVIAEIPGSEKPDELVIVGGHIDSWDGATGTTDNGTGVATTLEAARLLMVAGAQPRRTIRFMLWSGEEQGLLGSRGYIEKHPEENAKISAVLVHDGGTNYVAGIPATEDLLPLFEQAFAELKDLDPEMPFVIRKVNRLPFPIGSDHDSYLMAGVPGFFWDQKGRANYNHTHHTQHDTFAAAIPEYQRHSSMVIALGALGVANLPELLPRTNLPRGVNPAAQRRRLGVQLVEGTLRIDAVNEDGLARKAGIVKGDEIVAVDGKAVTTFEDLAKELNGGEPVKKVKVRRNGQSVVVEIRFPGAK